MSKATRFRDVEIRARLHQAERVLVHRGVAAHADEQPDPDVAENPKELVVYGGIGWAARNWECYDKDR